MANFQFSFEAIGTHWVIDCFGVDIKKEFIKNKVEERVEEFDKTYSRFRKDSLIWKATINSGELIFPSDSSELFDNYRKLYKLTSGQITPIIGNALNQAGYDIGYTLSPKKISKLPKIDEVYNWDYPVLNVKRPCIIDFGAMGKGYLVDIVCALLKENGINTFIVDAGGDIRCENLSEDLRIGLENPNNSDQAIGIVSINNQSICASSGNRRKWDKYHHIINPKTLKSVDNILATWVISKEGIIADGLATALFFEDPKKLSKYYKFEYLILYPDFKFKKSKKFPAELFLKNK